MLGRMSAGGLNAPKQFVYVRVCSELPRPCRALLSDLMYAAPCLYVGGVHATMRLDQLLDRPLVIRSIKPLCVFICKTLAPLGGALASLSRPSKPSVG